MITKRPTQTQLNQHTSPFTKVAFGLGILAVVVMMYLYFAHMNNPADQAWIQYCLYMTVFALTGLFGIPLLNNQPVIPAKFALLDLNTGVKAAIILAACMITQILTKFVLSFTATEQRFYFVFAAVCEELFFRGLLITLFLKLSDQFNMKIGAIVISAAMFTAIHQNYYNDLTMLFGVFLGGIVLGIFFVVWKNITANILGHFMLNLIASQNLAAIGWSPILSIIMVIVVGAFLIVIIRYVEKDQPFTGEVN